MPRIKPLHKPKITHIGHLDKVKADRKEMPDGPGIAVSEDPEYWRSKLRSNAPAHELEWSPAQWFDPMDMDDLEQEELRDWMLHLDYMEPGYVFHALRFHPETNEPEEILSTSLREAAEFIGRTKQEELAAQKEGKGGVTREDGYHLTRRAMGRLGGVSRWPNPADWFTGAVLLYTRQVVMKKRPFVVGVWWQQADEPYGVLFPERLHEFSLIDEEGDEQTARDAFPDFPWDEIPKEFTEDDAFDITKEMVDEAFRRAGKSVRGHRGAVRS